MIRFELNLTGHGWVECVISNGERGATVTASFLTDAIGEFVSVVQSLPTASAGTCDFAEEPGCYRWHFERDGDKVRIAVRWNDEQSSNWHLRFECECGLIDFVRAVDSALARNLEELGEQGYQQLWGYRFPKEAHERLKHCILALQRNVIATDASPKP